MTTSTAKPRRLWPLVAGIAILLAAAGIYKSGGLRTAVAHRVAAASATPAVPTSSAAARKVTAFQPTEAHWRTLTIEPVVEMPFRTTLVTDGKIGIDEDRTTSVFSPYVGRVTKLHVKPGDKVEAGAPLFVVEATDMVQGQNDFLAAKASLNKAKSQLTVATIVLKRHRDLLAVQAVAKREVEQAEITQVAAVNDLKSAEVALEAARNRMRILGKSDAEIKAFELGTEQISPSTTVVAPLTGTIVQRKVGPGQLVTAASTDPVFVIGDLSRVWLVANVRESDSTQISVGQKLEFTVLAQPEKVFSSSIAYVASSVNPDTHRLQVRAEVANPDGVLRPEMFATVSIVTSTEEPSASIPRGAVIYEGEEARVWLVREDKSVELRKIRPGIVANGNVQVLAGLKPGEKIITKGSLFIDRLAAPSVVEHD